jgi:hypothetical protein
MSTVQEQQKEHRKEKFDITVITSAGDLEAEFNGEEPLKAVFERALALVGASSQPDQFTLEYENQQLTDLQEKIEDAAKRLGWTQRVELELVPHPEVI